MSLLSALETDRFSGETLINEALAAIRTHFGMPVAYLSRFEDEYAEFRNVSAPGLEDLIKPGDRWELSQIYCPRVASGEFPAIIPDTNDIPACQELAITKDVPIRSHISLPVVMDNGEVYGMFCCLSPEPNASLNDRDLAVMSTFAKLVTRQVQKEEHARKATEEDLRLICDIIEDRRFTPVFQPLVRMSDQKVIGVEGLSRFKTDPHAGPEEIFSKAANLGLDLELELATLAAQMAEISAVPNDIYFSVNASAELICDPRFLPALPEAQRHRMVIELTEHSLANDEAMLQACISALQDEGIRVAIDDVGAGYSGLQRIAQLQPDILKIDRSIVSGIEESLPQRAIVAALVHFAAETNASVIVEGIETEQQSEVVMELGVDLAQGWLYARAGPMAEHFPHVKSQATG